MRTLVMSIAILTFAVFGFIGCAEDDPEEQSSAEQRSGDDVQTAMSDASITTSVKTRLISDKVVSGSEVEVQTEDGVVSLRGSVKDQATADRALELAKGVEGVRAVHSYLKTGAQSDESEDNTDEPSGPSR